MSVSDPDYNSEAYLNTTGQCVRDALLPALLRYSAFGLRCSLRAGTPRYRTVELPGVADADPVAWFGERHRPVRVEGFAEDGNSDLVCRNAQCVPELVV